MASTRSFVSRYMGSKGHKTSWYKELGTRLPLLPERCMLQNPCTCASFNNEKANSKRKVRMECVAAVHFMRNKELEKVIDACLQHPSVQQHW